MHSGSNTKVLHQARLDLDRGDGGTRQIAGRTRANQQARKARPLLGRRVQPRGDLADVIGFER